MREHAPWCDTVLGPDFAVEPGVVHMTIFACVNYACWDDPPTTTVYKVTSMPSDAPATSSPALDTTNLP